MKLAVWMVGTTLAWSVTVLGQPGVNGVWSSETSPDLVASPYVLELKAAAGKLTGNLRQAGGPQPGPVELSDGKMTAKEISFKVKSPDGDRTITFVGQINGDTIVFKREVQVREGGFRGGAGLFGALGPPAVTMKRQAAAAPGRPSTPPR
jgi:hypothetical protein